MISRRLRKNTGAESDTPGLDMSSLIDVSFLMLVFFIATSTLHPKESDLGLGLGRPGNPIELDHFTIEIDEAGVVRANDEEILETNSNSRELPRLRERLKIYKTAAALSDSDALFVSIEAHDQAKGQRFIDVLNCVAGAGIKEVTLSGF